MESKNPHYVCSDHQNYCTLVCINPDCVFKPLCEACISRHQREHMSEIVPLDQVLQKKMIMPSIFAQAFHKLKQTVFSLQMQVNNKRTEDLKRFMFFCESVRRSFEESLKDFEERGARLITQTYESFPKEISDMLQKINENEIAFDPNMNSPFFSSQRVENSLVFQSQYRAKFFPSLEQEVEAIAKNIESSYCEISEERIRNELVQFLDVLFKKHDNFKISKVKKAGVPKSLKTQSKAQPRENNHNSLIRSAILSIDDGNSLNFHQSNSDRKGRTARGTSPYKHLSDPKTDFGSVSLLGSHKDMINCICVIPDTNWLFSGGGDKSIKQWDYKSCYFIKELKGHLGDVWSLVYIGEGNFIASASSDKTVRLWNVMQSTCIKLMSGHLSVVRCLAFDEQEKTLISGSVDQNIKVWDIYSGVCKETLKGHQNIVRCLCWIQKERRLISGGGDGVIKLWDFKSIEKNEESLIGHRGEVWSIIYIQELRVMLSCGTDRMIRIWDLEGLKIIKILMGHDNIINKLLYLKDEKRILSSGSDFTMRLWNIHSGQNIRTFNEHEDVVSDMVYVEGIILTASWDRTIKKWSLFE